MSKIVFITGATAGFGEACAYKFAANSYDLIINGRRTDRLQVLADALEKKYNVAVLQLPFDVQHEKEVFESINNIPADWKAIDVLINNAGLALGRDYFEEADLNDWNVMIDTNVKGFLYVGKAVSQLMAARKQGHIINMGSIAGKEVYAKGNVYCATKAAVDMLAKGMRIDLLPHGIKVTSVHPGAVETEFSLVRFHGDKKRAEAVYDGFTPLAPEDVAETIWFAATAPAHVNVSDLVLLPSAQAGSGQIRKQ